MPCKTSSKLRRSAAVGLMTLTALAAGSAWAQADPPPSSGGAPAAAAVRTPVAPPTAVQAPAAPMVVPRGQEPTTGTAVAAAEARYAREKQRCESGRSNQDMATCMKEAGAALEEARRHALDTGDTAATRRANAVARCLPLPEAERRDCEARMVAGTTEGSVGSGGVLRELTVIETVPPAAGTAPATKP
jgi:hypothetical protein